MRRLGPCTILAKYGNNAYQVELLEDIGQSPIFNVVDLVRYKGPTPDVNRILKEVIQDVEDLNLTPPPLKVVKKVLDSRVYKQTRTRAYWEHIIK